MTLPPLPPVISRMTRALETLDSQAYLDCFADGFVCQEPATGRTVDREELRSHVAVTGDNWSSFAIEMTDAIVDGSTVAIEYTCHMVGRAHGFEGVEISLPCNSLVDIAEDGRIQGWFEQYDTGAMRRARRRD